MKNLKEQATYPLCKVVGYEHLKMYQPREYFRMTSDSLALAQFVEVHYRDKQILDIGTGLAGIPLILSTKSKAHITGIEIEEKVADIAKKSVCYNHLEEQITIICQDIKEYAKRMPPNIYDIITSNPPYYAFQTGAINEHSVVAQAKHNLSLELEDIFVVANKLLKDQGRLVLVFTTDRFIEVINLYQKFSFAVKRLQFIYGKKGKKSKTFLIEGSKNGRAGMEVLSPLIWK